MIPYDEALMKTLDAARLLPGEETTLEQSLGRVLARDVQSDVDIPPFDKSAMDGFACRRADLDQPLTMVDHIPAGKLPSHALGPGQCAEIMTGAAVSPGADCVVKVEDTAKNPDGRIRFNAAKTSTNICYRGEDVRIGDTVLQCGARIGPAEIALLASVGCTRPWVACRPRVAVIPTGSELVEPHRKPEGAMIRNSNSHQLCAQVTAMGATAWYDGIAGDQQAVIHSAIENAAAEKDLLLLSGGVSVGVYDLVPGILKANGFELLFESVAMKPGKPTVFGLRDDGQRRVYCCGLPGNPVSTYVIFEILVKPFLYALMGHAYQPTIVPARLKESISRKKTVRQSSIPVRLLAGGTAEPIKYHGSAHIHAMCKAHGIVTVPVGVGKLEKGQVVDVRLIMS